MKSKHIIKKNDSITLKITGVTSEGSGVGRTGEDLVVFVPNAAVGDVLQVHIVKVKKNYAFGKIEQIITPSEHRIQEDCPYFSKCGGCVYRHIAYGEELRLKQQLVTDSLRRIGGLEQVKVNPIIGAKQVNHYRNKAQLPIGVSPDGTPLMGYYAFHSHRIINCNACLLQPDIFTKVMEITREFLAETNQDIYQEETHKGKLRHLYMRYGEKTEELMVCYVVNGNGLQQENILIQRLKSNIPQLKSLIINSNREKTNVILGSKNRTAWGADAITDILCGLRFKISPLSFYQVNRRQAELLYSVAKNYADLKKHEVLLDLYCGTGTIGLTMADQCKTLIGVEVVQQAVENARENAKLNNIKNAEFICSDAADAAKRLHKSGIKPNVVIVDPPRKGCGDELIETIAEMQPERIVYVSCDPATLARDLKRLEEKEYYAKELTPVDMFPRTAHVECVVLMSRKDG